MNTKLLLSTIALLTAFVFCGNAADIQYGKITNSGTETTVLTYTPSSTLILKSLTASVRGTSLANATATIKVKVGGVLKYEVVLTGGGGNATAASDNVVLSFGDGLQFSGSEAVTITSTSISGSGTTTGSLFFQ